MRPAIAAVLLGAVTPTFGAGNAERGAQLFRQCAACHSTEPGEHLTGPSLAQVWNRKAGTAAGFQRYSDALKRADVIWSEATLDIWLANPDAFIHGTSMTFSGIRQQRDREDVIAYLRAVSGDKAPPAAKGGGMMGMQRGKPDLHKAPPEGQVTALRHCGDAYTTRPTARARRSGSSICGSRPTRAGSVPRPASRSSSARECRAIAHR